LACSAQGRLGTTRQDHQDNSCHMPIFPYVTCGNALTMLWFICVIFVSFLAFDTRFGLFEKLM
jgi:hypothetical protein